MFDIGWSEMMVIGIVALVFVGPKDLPKMFRTVGEFTGKARGMAREFQRAMEAAAKESGADEMTRDLKRTMSGQDFKDAAGFDEIDEQFRSIGRTVNDIRKPSNLVKKAVLGDGSPDPGAETPADDLSARNAEIGAVEAERIKRAKKAAEARRQAADIRARREAAEAEQQAQAWEPARREADARGTAAPAPADPASAPDDDTAR